MAIRYLLDTNICIYIAKHNPPAVRARFEEHTADSLAMSVITMGELRYGAQKSQLRISAIVDDCFSLIVDGVSTPSWTRGGCAQARGSIYLNRPRSV